MTVALWCVGMVLLLPYLLSLAARSQVTRSQYVGDPRAYSEGLVGWHRRAHLAHLNAFEALPTLIAGVMVAELAHAPRVTVDALALAFVVCRLLHAAFYITDRAVLRSHAWRLGMICIVALFVVAGVQGHR
ncbi:MAG: MAPEG family protein [Rubrivivax sp.]